MFGEIEGTGFEVIRPEFSNRLIGHARVERLWAGARCSEGPAWFAAGRYLVWSDIPNNRVLSYNETDGSVSVFRARPTTRTATRWTGRDGPSPASTSRGG